METLGGCVGVVRCNWRVESSSGISVCDIDGPPSGDAAAPRSIRLFQPCVGTSGTDQDGIPLGSRMARQQEAMVSAELARVNQSRFALEIERDVRAQAEYFSNWCGWMIVGAFILVAAAKAIQEIQRASRIRSERRRSAGHAGQRGEGSSSPG